MPPGKLPEYEYHAMHLPTPVKVHPELEGQNIIVTLTFPDGRRIEHAIPEPGPMPTFTVRDLSTISLLDELERRFNETQR